MQSHPDVLDSRDLLRHSLLGSVGFHAAVVALITAYYAAGGGSTTERWGDVKSLGGGSVGITPVDRIPLVRARRTPEPGGQRHRIAGTRAA
jgi:hypothetical protein